MYVGEEMCVGGFGKEAWRNDAICATSRRWEDYIEMDHQEIKRTA
jgi:hypothetical protein